MASKHKIIKRQPYDYSEFSLRRLNDPRFCHAKLLGSWIFYFVMYLITENLISEDKCHIIHCALDDMIPFNEFFVIFYAGWYLLVIGSLAYTFFYNVPSFRKLQIFIFCTQMIAMACYIIYPSRQTMRPETFERSNIFTFILGIIYAVDTSTGICPSLHVGYSLGILSVALKDRELATEWKVALGFTVFMICCSVCFVKQHSALDVLWALPMCLVAECITYGRDYWLPKLRGSRRRKQTA